MKNIIFKTILKKGAKGARGDQGEGFTVPTGAIIAYDDINTPEGYEDTDAPIEATLITKTITENDTYNASDDNADGYSSVTVDVQGSSIDFVLNDETIATPTQGSYTVTLDGKLPRGLYLMSIIIVEENNVVNNLVNYIGGSLTFQINGNTTKYNVSFSGDDAANTTIQSICTWGSWKTLKCKLSKVDSTQIY